MRLLNGRYELEEDAEPIGKGAEGYVYLVIDKKEKIK